MSRPVQMSRLGSRKRQRGEASEGRVLGSGLNPEADVNSRQVT